MPVSPPKNCPFPDPLTPLNLNHSARFHLRWGFTTPSPLTPPKTLSRQTISLQWEFTTPRLPRWGFATPRPPHTPKPLSQWDIWTLSGVYHSHTPLHPWNTITNCYLTPTEIYHPPTSWHLHAQTPCPTLTTFLDLQFCRSRSHEIAAVVS